VIVRALLPDEVGNAEAAELLFGDTPCVTSAISLVEVTGALAAARRARRLDERTLGRLLPTPTGLSGGNVAVLALDPAPTLARAWQLVIDHRLRALDALHLAVAHLDARKLTDPGEDLHFATRDADQAAAARALGLLTEP
jgi:predicted nucleic acid-binding protein